MLGREKKFGTHPKSYSRFLCACLTVTVEMKLCIFILREKNEKRFNVKVGAEASLKIHKAYNA